MDFATIIGLLLAGVAIIGGFLLEGGHVGAILQPTAGIIVVGGTVGAIFVQFPLAHIKHGARGMVAVFFAPKVNMQQLITDLVDYSQTARREGIVALEAAAERATDPFLKKALGLAVDGSESRVVRDAMEVELDAAEEHGMAGSKVFEAAGGYSPTVGILGAVLGLIHVMENLSDPSKLGAGIAVAFVATVYGVALANLIFLPMAGKLKVRHQQEMAKYELILAGVCAIAEGENPRIIEEKLKGFQGGAAGGGNAPAEKAA